MAQRGRATGRQPGRPAARAVAPVAAQTKLGGAETAARRTRLLTVIEPVVTGAGYDLEELVLKQIGRRYQVRVMIDGDGGVNLDVIAEVARAVSKALDEAEEAGPSLISGEYQLEVSSPGVDRPLTLPRHWRRNAGRLVKVKLGERTVTGRVISADDAGVILDVNGAQRSGAYGDLGQGRVQVEFNRMNELADSELAEIDDNESDEELDELDDEDDEGER
jgi:ribosome maturation factor RimP